MIATSPPVLSVRVAVPAFYASGHTPDEIPTDARPFDPRAYDGLLAHARQDAHTGTRQDRAQPVGIWTLDTVRYADDTPDLLRWIAKRTPRWKEQRHLFRQLARPLSIVERLIAQNIVTDTGAGALLKVVGTAAPTLYFNHLQLCTGAAVAQVSTAMGTTGVTAIPVISNGTAFTNGMSITLGFGTANAETLTVGSGSTSTSIVCGATTKTHNANDWVVQNPLTSDNPSSVSNGYDSGALASGAFTYSGTGAGNRQVQVIYDFPANSSAPGAGYVDMYTSSAAIIAAGTTGSHLTHSPLLVNGSTGVNATYTISL